MIGTGVFTSLGFQLNDLQSIFPLLMLWVVGGFIALYGVEETVDLIEKALDGVLVKD